MNPSNQEYARILQKVKDNGPWVQHFTSYGEPWYECYFCGSDREIRIADKKSLHDSDCLWLEVERYYENLDS
jgi:hypothetical protein